MAVKITICRQSPDQEKTLEFDDSATRINFGRDAKANHIVFPATDTIVGRSHCAIRRELGRYRMVLNERNVVYVDGEPAIDDQELPDAALLQLGPGGPVVRVEVDDASSLPPTEEHASAVGKTAMIKGAHQKSHSAVKAAWAAVAGLLAVAAVIAFAIRRQEGINESMGIQIVSAAELDADQEDLLASLNNTTKRIGRGGAAGTAGFDEVLEDVARSVYLVIKQDAEDFEETVATAWVVDDAGGVFASNAHVAEELDALAEGSTLILRSSTAPRRDFVIERVTIHPGYRQFDEIWAEYQPVTRSHSTQLSEVAPPGAACDVALLYAADAEGIGPALTLASDEELASLRAGTPIAFVGFPMEGIALGGANPQEPATTTQIAYVTACTDYFGSPDVPVEQRQLIQNSLPLTGGASGSPIVNEDGHVVGVVSAGNLVGATEDNVRVWSAALINYGQRIDLVRELLDETADAVQAERQRIWLAGLDEHFEKRAVALSRISEAEARLGWLAGLALDGDYDVRMDGHELNPTGDGGEATVRVEVDDAQFLLVTAVKGDAAAADPTLSVGVGGNDPERIGWEGEPGETVRVARLEPQGRPTEVVVGRLGGASDDETQVRAFSANRSLRSLESRLETAVTRLHEILEGAGIENESVRVGTRRRVTLDENRDNGAGMAGIVITPERPGYYLFTVAGNNGEDVDLAVSQTTATASEERARDDSYSSWAAVVVQVDDAKGVTLNGAIVAPKAGIQCTLDVYFVPLAATPAT